MLTLDSLGSMESDLVWHILKKVGFVNLTADKVDAFMHLFLPYLPARC